MLRDVKQAEPPSPAGVHPLASPREALGCLQAATATLLGFTLILARYGDLGDLGGLAEDRFLHVLGYFSEVSAE